MINHAAADGEAGDDEGCAQSEITVGNLRKHADRYSDY